MSEFTHVTSTTTRQPMLVMATEKVTATHFVEAAFGGKVRFAKRRSSGTLRSWPLLAPGSKERKEAEALEASTAKQGVSATAKAQNVSVATLRRTLTALSFSREVEGLKGQARQEWTKAANSNLEVAAKQAPAPKEQAPEEPKAEPKQKAKAKASKASGQRQYPSVATMRKRLVETGIYENREAAEKVIVKTLKADFDSHCR